MQTMIHGQQAVGQDRQRETIHDLRNLFGIVAAAHHLLEREPRGAERTDLLGALQDAARRGGELTTRLLANGLEVPGKSWIRVGERLRELEPLVNALAGERVQVEVRLPRLDPAVRFVPVDFDAAILELIANSIAAAATRIRIRVAHSRARTSVLIADNGRGMSPEQLGRAKICRDSGEEHGAGLSRVQRSVRVAHGTMRVRSHLGRGTTIALILPTVLKAVVNEPGAAERRPTTPKEKEKHHEEDRCRVAA